MVISSSDFLSIPADKLSKTFEGLPFNCLKIDLSEMPSISKIIESYKQAKTLGLSVLVSSTQSGTTTEYHDTLIVDLAIGLGCRQINTGGLLCGQFLEKFNRCAEIEKDNCISISTPAFRSFS